MNLLIQVREDITDSVSEELADILRLSIEDLNKAIDIFLPGILGGIAQIGKNKSGAISILNTINEEEIHANSGPLMAHVAHPGESATFDPTAIPKTAQQPAPPHAITAESRENFSGQVAPQIIVPEKPSI